MKKNFTILGIETSCDETAAAVYQSNSGLRANVIYSQTELHKRFGGVIPELASRSHIEKINPIVHEALAHAQSTVTNIDVVAVTNKPGLPGSLLIGVAFAKGLAWAAHKKIIGIDHLEGHIFSSFLEFDVPFPHLCLTASGGHTALYLVKNFGEYQLLGQTLDDAAGEAFDKIAKLLNLPYPGGPVIEKLAREVQFQDFFNYPRGQANTLEFSFSGLKTAVLYDMVRRNLYDLKNKTVLPLLNDQIRAQIASSLLVCIKDIFVQKIELALRQHPTAKAVTFVGGVACNKFIKEHLKQIANQHGLLFFNPSAQFCTDNAAMIAFVGSYKAKQNKFSDFSLDIFK